MRRPSPAEARLFTRPVVVEVAVVLLALAVRWVVADSTWHMPLVRSPRLDSREFLIWANAIRAGTGWWPTLPTHGAVYPLFLAALLSITGGSLYVTRLLQAVVGAASVWLVFDITRRSFGGRAAIVSGVLVAVYGPLVYVETSLYEEGLFIFLLLASLWAMSIARRPLASAIAGFALGVATVMRPTAIGLLPLFLFIEWRQAPRARLRIAVLFVAALAVVAVVLAHNYRVSGSTTIRGYGGLNAYMGNRPGGSGVADARPDERWDRLQAEPLSRGFVSASAQDRYFVSKAVDEIRRDPGGWLKVLGLKLLWLTQRVEIRESHSYQFFTHEDPVLAVLPGFGLLFPLAAAGLALSLRRRTTSLLLAGYLVVMAVGCVAFVVGLRYRLPLAPVLAMFAGCAVAEAWEAVRRRQIGQIRAATAVALACSVLTWIAPHRPSQNFAEEYAFTGDALMDEHDLDGAEAAYRESAALDPAGALGLDGLALVAFDRGKVAEAEETLREAVRRQPGWAAAHLNLGRVLRRRGDVPAAIDEFQKAVRIRPDNARAASELADSLFAARRYNEALEQYRSIERQGQPNAALYVAMARTEGQMGDIAEAERLATRAIALDPGSGEAWFVLSVAQRLAGQFNESEASLAEAARHNGADLMQLRLATAMLRRAQGRREEANRLIEGVLEQAPAMPDARALWLQYAEEDHRLPEAERTLEMLSRRR